MVSWLVPVGVVVRAVASATMRTVGACIVAAVLASGCTTADSGVHTQSVDSPTTTPSIATSGETTPESTRVANSNLTPSITSGDSSPAQPWPSDFTPAQQEAAQAALDAVAGFTNTLSQANAEPAKDWTAAVRKYAADPAATLTLRAIQSLAAAQVHVSAPSIYEHPTVMSADANRVVVDVCVDRSQSRVLDALGATVLAPPDPARTIVAYTAALYPPADGGWLITETAGATPARPC